MEKKREHEQRNGYTSPIYAHKKASNYCLQYLDSIALMWTSYHKAKNHLAVQATHNKQMTNKHPHRHFSQLCGMSRDHVPFNKAAACYSISQHLPFGPVKMLFLILCAGQKKTLV